MNVETISTLIGFVMPPVVEFINARIKWEKVRFYTSVILCVLVGVAITYVANGYTSWEDLVRNSGIVFAASQTAYYTYFKKSTLDKTINEVMEKRGVRT